MVPSLKGYRLFPVCSRPRMGLRPIRLSVG